MTEDIWVKNSSGLYVPPKAPAPCVEKAEFAVKVVGFTAPANMDKAARTL